MNDPRSLRVCITSEPPIPLKGVGTGLPRDGATPGADGRRSRGTDAPARRGNVVGDRVLPPRAEIYKRPSKHRRFVMRFHSTRVALPSVPRTDGRAVGRVERRRTVARLEAGLSHRASRVRSDRVSAAQTELTPGELKQLSIMTVERTCARGGNYSRCSIPCLETFASVISSGIQSGLLSGADSRQDHPS